MTHFPDHPHDGETVAEEIGPDQARIWTYNEAQNEWTYKDYGSSGQLVFTDQVLVRENAGSESPHSALAEPSELKTQKEVNYYLDEKFGQGPDINLDDYATKEWVTERDYATEEWTTAKIAEAQLEGEDVDLSAYATISYADAGVAHAKQYADSKDQLLQNQIDELEVQKGSAANFDCKAAAPDPYNCRPGEAYFNNAVASLVTIVGLGAEDKSGVLTKTVNVGDIIEFVSPDGSDSRFRATDVTGYPIYMSVEFVSGDQNFVVDQQYTVYIYPQNEAGATKDYVDAQDALYLPLAGGVLTGALSGPGFKGLKDSGPVITVGPSSDQIKAIIHADGHAQFTYPTLDQHAASKKYVDDAIGTGGATDGCLPLTGGTLKGPLTFNRDDKESNQFKISPNGREDYATNIYSLNGGTMRLRTSHTNNEGDHVGSHIILDPNGGSPTTKIYNLSNPTSGHMAVSKDYVDQQIRAATTNNALTQPCPFSWKWTDQSNSNDPGDKNFSHDGTYYRLSFKTANGHNLGSSKFDDTGAQSWDYGPVMTIWYKNDPDGKTWKLKTIIRVNKYRWNYHNHFEFGYSSRKGSTTYTVGTTYLITVGGFF